MSIQHTEAESAALAVAPRVSLADIEGSIALRIHVSGLEAAHARLIEPAAAAATEWTDEMVGSLERLSICILVMKNGFTIIGKSAPVSPANYNADIERNLAYEDAIRQFWQLMGFALRERLHQGN